MVQTARQIAVVCQPDETKSSVLNRNRLAVGRRPRLPTAVDRNLGSLDFSNFEAAKHVDRPRRIVHTAMFLPRSTGLAIAAPSRLLCRQPVRHLSWLSGWNAPKATPPMVVDESLPVAQTGAVPVPPTSRETPTTPLPERSVSTPEPYISTPSPAAFSTVNQAEIDHFSRLSSQWWNERGEFGLLHKMNPTRMEFVRQKIENGRVDDRGWTYETRNATRSAGGEGRWLEGMDVLDVGCGGGLLSEVSFAGTTARGG